MRWSRIAPRLALAPAAAVTAVAFIGSIGWSVYLSFTASRRFPDYEIVGLKQYVRLFSDPKWTGALWNLGILGLGSLASIAIGFLLAAFIDRDVRGESLFRTVFLYPLAVSLIVTGIVWRWLFDPQFGVESVFHALGFEWVNFSWIASPHTVMYGIILASVWQNTGFFMALMLSGLKGINPDIWKAGRLDGAPFWRFYAEVVIPMMKFTFLTCAILISINVVKAYDVILAMTQGGPGTASYVPAYFAINAYWEKANLGYASAAAAIMLAMTFALFLPFVAYTAWRSRQS